MIPPQVMDGVAAVRLCSFAAHHEILDCPSHLWLGSGKSISVGCKSSSNLWGTKTGACRTKGGSESLGECMSQLQHADD